MNEEVFLQKAPHVRRACKDCGKPEWADEPHEGCHKPKETPQVSPSAEDRRKGTDYPDAKAKEWMNAGLGPLPPAPPASEKEAAIFNTANIRKNCEWCPSRDTWPYRKLLKACDIIDKQTREHEELKSWNADLQVKHTVLLSESRQQTRQLKVKDNALRDIRRDAGRDTMSVQDIKKRCDEGLEGKGKSCAT